MAGFCHLAQLWVALGLPPSPRARNYPTSTEVSLPQFSALAFICTLANSSTVANRLTKRLLWFSNLWKSVFSAKVPCILTWFWGWTFWRWGRQPRVIGLIVWTQIWTISQHNRLCANQVAWPSSSSTISDYVLLHTTVCFLSWSTGINTAQYQFWLSFWLLIIWTNWKTKIVCFECGSTKYFFVVCLCT